MHSAHSVHWDQQDRQQGSAEHRQLVVSHQAQHRDKAGQVASHPWVQARLDKVPQAAWALHLAVQQMAGGLVQAEQSQFHCSCNGAPFLLLWQGSTWQQVQLQRGRRGQ